MTAPQPNLVTDATRQRSERHLKLALEKVSAAWFPVNPVQLNKIKTGIARGAYDIDVDFLINDIKSDLSLLTYCLKRINLEDKKDLPQYDNPLDRLRHVGIGRLKQILAVDEKTISPHEMSEVGDIQKLRLQECLISTATAEVLSEHEKINPELGFSTALARQLGLILIAWNYPHVYRRQLSQRAAGESLEQALDSALGFSPELLGLAVAHRCGVNVSGESATGPIGQTLEKICEVGEALARANSPEIYPTARADWEQAEAEIDRVIGEGGIRTIREKISTNSEQYIALFPETFKKALAVDPALRIRTRPEGRPASGNQYLRNCPQDVREKLEAVYSRMSSREISRESIQLLTRAVITELGFVTGCIYLWDPASMSLVPRTLVGKATARDFSPVHYSDASGSRDIVNSAFNSQAPVIESGLAGNETRLAAAIGDEQRAGVFYLECPTEGRLSDPLLVFKALRKTLIDCLNLR